MNKMKSYPVISVDKKYCKFTEPMVLKALRICIQCNKIPLPSFKSSQNYLKTYCLNCYNQHKFDPLHLIMPSKESEILLEKLVINCKFEEKGCKETYQTNTLQNLLDHEKECFYNQSKNLFLNEILENYLKNNALNIELANNDCLTTLLKLVLEIATKIKILTSLYEQLITDNEQNYHNNQTHFTDLSHRLDSSLEKQYINLITHLKTNNTNFKQEIQFNLNQIMKKQKKFKKEIQVKINSLETELSEKNIYKEMKHKNNLVETDFRKNQTNFNKEIEFKINSAFTDLKQIKSNIKSQDYFLEKNNEPQNLHKESQVIPLFEIDLKSNQNQINNNEIKLNNIIHKIKNSTYIIFEQQRISFRKQFIIQQKMINNLHSGLNSDSSSLNNYLRKEIKLVSKQQIFNSLNSMQINQNKIQICSQKLNSLISNFQPINLISQTDINHKQSIIDHLLQNNFTQININSLKDFNLLSTLLSKSPQLSNLTLNFRSNQIGDIGIKDLSTALVKLTQIMNLNLYIWNNQIGDSGVKDLSTALCKLTQILNLNINLSYNQIGPKGLKDLSNSLSKLTLISNLTLNLSYNQIGPSGIKDLSTALTKLTEISNLSLNLSYNQIGPTGLKDLSTSLSKLSQISNLTLNLRNNEKGLTGANELSSTLSNLQRLTNLILDLSHYQIGDSGVKEFSLLKEKSGIKLELNIN